MKKILFLLIAIWASECYAMANDIAVKDVTLFGYDTSAVEVNLTNTASEIVAVQFNISLPDGIKPVMEGNDIVINASDRLAGDYILRARQVADGSYLFVFLSKDRTPIKSESGTLFTFHIKKVQKNDGDYIATVSNVVLSDNKGEKTTLENSSFAVKVISKYDVIYVIDGEEYKRDSYIAGSQVVPEPEPTRDGYTFSGWSEIPETMPSHDVKVVGNFIVSQYKVTFISDGETIMEETLDFGSTIIAPENPLKVGYSFCGWNPTVDATVPAHDVTYVAQFSIVQYTITFDTDGGTEIAPITQDFNSTVTAPANPTKTGHTFVGWDKEIPSTMPADNILIKALWVVNKYHLIYMIDGEVYRQYEVDYHAAITPETAPEKEGHTFSGWSEIPLTMPANDVEVTATFTVNQYKVSFIVDGTTVKEEILDYGSPINTPEDPSMTGHTFIRWNPAIDATVPAHNVTYVAQFSIVQYTITFDTDGGTEIAPITQDFNSTVMAPANPTKTGYTFVGWDKELPSTMPAESITIKALWTINQYTITFDTDGGSEIAPITQDYNSTVTAPANPTKTGYTFVGWDKEIPNTMPAESITIKALWTVNTYKLTYKVDGEVYKEYDVEYGATITPEEAPEKEGHTFSGWSDIPDTMPANSVVLEGTFTINQYTITFDTDGGTELAPITQDYHSTVTAPANPTKMGYTFIGWDKEIPSTMPAESFTIKALWTINQYTITFDTDGGTEIAPITQDYGTEISAPENPTKEGFVFIGWDKEIPATMPAEDINIKALWEEVHDGIGGICSDDQDVSIYSISGSKVTMPLKKGIYIINGKKVLITKGGFN